MSSLQGTSISFGDERPKIRRIDGRDLNWALMEGWRDFKAMRGDLIFLALIYPLVGFIAAAVTLNDRSLPMMFPLVAGISLLGPAVAMGFYELARRREAGLDSSWRHFLDPVRGPNRWQLVILTDVLALLFVGWLASAYLIYLATLGAGADAHGLSEFARRLFTTPRGWTMIVVGNLVGFAFAAVTLALALVSFPIVIDRSIAADTAMVTSVRAVAENPRAVASWGLRVAVLLALGCLPVFIGLAVVLPVLGYASWHLYTRLIER
jgi:uncharacterized membrane protein